MHYRSSCCFERTSAVTPERRESPDGWTAAAAFAADLLTQAGWHHPMMRLQPQLHQCCVSLTASGRQELLQPQLAAWPLLQLPLSEL